MFAKLPRRQKLEIVRELQQYFRDELDEEIGDLPAEFLLDFVAGKMGPFYYNQALADARVVVGQRWQTLDEELFALEQPLPKRGDRAPKDNAPS